MLNQHILGGIDAGGTSFKCIVGTGPENVLAGASIAVSDEPNDTLEACVQTFKAWAEQFGPFVSLGVACFGPVNLNGHSEQYGCIQQTPKPGWSGTPIKNFFERDLGIPVGFNTDVNGALLAEHKWGAGQGLQHLCYVTVGTGIGGGVLVDGSLFQGATHPELGHMRVPRHHSDQFAGICSFHNDCLEGLACGPAMAARAGTAAEHIADDHSDWDLEAYYLASMCANLYLCYSPQKIILGGGVLQNQSLLAKVRDQFSELMNGYVGIERTPKNGTDSVSGHEEVIVKAALGTRAGALGALILAQKAAL